jgi:hypothetical protein
MMMDAGQWEIKTKLNDWAWTLDVSFLLVQAQLNVR